MLSPERVERLRKALQDERVLLERSVAGLESDGMSVDESVGIGNHMAEDATETFDHEAQISLRLNQEHVLEAVNRALQRMETGRYGVCERCGQDIDFARLKALPYSAYCMDCQRLIEAEV